MSAAIPIIIDCDPGVDDAVAILAALASPELDVLALTPVSGNVAIEQTTRNALQICELAGRPDLPVFAGCAGPLCCEPIRGAFHGSEGLGPVLLPPPQKQVEARHAVDFLIARLGAAAQSGQRITLCTMGPLTNIAVALRKEPGIAAGIERLVMMGGAYREPGNRSLTSEFNMLADPHAAHVVMSSDVPIVAVPLDVTHQVMLKPEHVPLFTAPGGPVAEVLGTFMRFWDRNDVRRYGSPGGPLHDPCVILYVLAPHLFETRRASVYVEHESQLCRGQTVADWYGKTKRAPHVDVVMKADASRVLNLLTERLATYAG